MGDIEQYLIVYTTKNGLLRADTRFREPSVIKRWAAEQSKRLGWKQYVLFGQERPGAWVQIDSGPTLLFAPFSPPPQP